MLQAHCVVNVAFIVTINLCFSVTYRRIVIEF
jgi:hypothetical protein